MVILKLYSVVSEGAATFAWGGSLNDAGRLSYFVVRTLAQVVDSVSSVQGATNLLVGVYKTLELSIEMSVLAV